MHRGWCMLSLVNMDAALARLREILQQAPDERAWWGLVEVLDGVAPEEMSRFLDAGFPGGMPWPSTVERSLPLHWVQRLGDGEPVPEGRLVNAVDLGNGLALHQPDGFDLFFQLDGEQLDPLLSSLPDSIEVLSYSDDVGEHPYHPGFLVDPDMAISMLKSGRWARVHTVRFNGFGVSSFSARLVGALGRFPSLRRLEINCGDDQGGIQLDALRNVLQSPALERLEQLSMKGYTSLRREQAELLAGSQVTSGLKRLELGEVNPEVREILSRLAGVSFS
jgi:hypothetical protein